MSNIHFISSLMITGHFYLRYRHEYDLGAYSGEDEDWANRHYPSPVTLDERRSELGSRCVAIGREEMGRNRRQSDSSRLRKLLPHGAIIASLLSLWANTALVLVFLLLASFFFVQRTPIVSSLNRLRRNVLRTLSPIIGTLKPKRERGDKA